MATEKWKKENAEKMREYRRAYYYKNKESHYLRNEKTEQIIKEYTVSIRSNGCQMCPEKDPCCIDFHHLKDKEYTIARMMTMGSLSKVKKEIEKCVRLCANCHRKVHAGSITTEQLMEATGLQNLV